MHIETHGPSVNDTPEKDARPPARVRWDGPPLRPAADYDDLCAQVLEALPEAPHVLVAESFSGPVALKVAARAPQGLKALVLSASFAESPLPRLSLARGLIGPWFFRVSLPNPAIRALLAGREAPAELCQAVRDAVKTVDPTVLAFRLREVMGVDAGADLRRCPVPIFYLRGTKDRLLGKAAARAITTAKPDVTVIDVPGPHLLLQAVPDLCAAQIESLVSKLDWNGR
jgi:pimeloyl-ACP methyl ester carboxylesterase